jgi:hypothetical protein
VFELERQIEATNHGPIYASEPTKASKALVQYKHKSIWARHLGSPWEGTLGSPRALSVTRAAEGLHECQSLLNVDGLAKRAARSLTDISLVPAYFCHT